MPDPSCICNLYHSSRQLGILNPLSKARDWTRNLMISSWMRFHWTAMGTPFWFFFFNGNLKNGDSIWEYVYTSKTLITCSVCQSVRKQAFFFEGGTTLAYGSSQARGQIRAISVPYTTATATQVWVTSTTYTTAHGNARSLTHWWRIKHTSSWISVRLVTTEPQGELLSVFLLSNPTSRNLSQSYSGK